MPQPTVRIGGSGLTIFQWKSNTLAYLQTIQDTAPTPVAQAVPIQSITDPWPKEIVTARAVGAGTLKLTFYDLWYKNVWQNLAGFNTSVSLFDVLSQQITNGSVTCQKLIKLPDSTPSRPHYRTKIYQNCMVVDVDDGEQINIGTMVLPKGLSIMYTNYLIS